MEVNVERLKELRRERVLSLRELEERSGVSYNTIWRIEDGRQGALGMGRRGNGEGSISRRKDGLYMAATRYRPRTVPSGRRSTARRARVAKTWRRSSRRRWPTATAASPTTPGS